MFLMVSRASEMETGAVIQSKDLDSAVDTVVSRINEVLVEDLFGNDNVLVNAESLLSATGYIPTAVYADEGSDNPTHNPSLTPGPDDIWGTADDVVSNPGADAVSGTYDDPIVPVATNDDVWLPGQMDDFWLASLEPTWRDNNDTPGNPSDDNYVWPHITDLWGMLQGRSDSLYYQQYINTDHVYYPHSLIDLV